MLVSFHNHTDWSDGKNTIPETVAATRELGIDHFGISDHLALTPDNASVSWSMKPHRLDAYIEAIRASDSEARIGLEVDWFPESSKTIAKHLDRDDFDYVIGSVHFIGDFHVDSKADDWANLSGVRRYEMGLAYWRLIQGMAESGLFDIAAHLDLYKKFALCPDVSDTSEADAALDALAESGMAIEINTAGWFKPCADAYPSVPLLRKCRARGIPVLLSSDSHKAGDLLRALPEAAQRAKDAGYDVQCCFRKRERLEVALPAA